MSQSLWTAIDSYINQHLIPEQPQLKKTLENTALHGFSNHLAVAPNQGMFLKMLVQMNHCHRVLELGTFAAYSTQWLAQGLPSDGYLLTVEGRDTHLQMARQNLDLAQSNIEIDLRHGKAKDVLNELITQQVEPFDLIFIDADKQSYAEYVELSLKLSHSGTVLVLDNVVRAGDILDPNNHKPSIEGIRNMYQFIQDHPQILSCTALQTVGCKGHDGFAIAIVK